MKFKIMHFLICFSLTKVLKFSFGLLLVQEFEFSDMLIVSFLQYFSMLILHLFNCVQMLILLFRKFLSVLLFQILVLQDSFLNLLVMLLALLFQSLKMIILSIRNVNFQILNLNLQTFNHFHILLVLLTVSIGINHNFLTCFNNWFTLEVFIPIQGKWSWCRRILEHIKHRPTSILDW